MFRVESSELRVEKTQQAVSSWQKAEHSYGLQDRFAPEGLLIRESIGVEGFRGEINPIEGRN